MHEIRSKKANQMKDEEEADEELERTAKEDFCCQMSLFVLVKQELMKAE